MTIKMSRCLSLMSLLPGLFLWSACSDAAPDAVGTQASPLVEGGSNEPDPSQVSITATIEGCGGSDTQISADNKLYAVTFSDARGGRDAFDTHDVACNVAFRYKFPAGYTFDAPSLNVHGDFTLAEEASFTINVRQSLAGTASTSKTFANARDGFVLSLPGGGPAGSAPCGATTATVNVQMATTFGGTGDASVTLDFIDGEIAWRRCP